MENLEFDDEASRLVEAYNESSIGQSRNKLIIETLNVKPGEKLLDIGCGPSHIIYELSTKIGPTGTIDGMDMAEEALSVGKRRCANLENINFHIGEATALPFDDNTYDVVMSCQVFEYIHDIPTALAEVYRVLKPGGRVLIYNTDWQALLWHSSDRERMAHIMEVWDGHLADPSLPQTLGHQMKSAGFKNVETMPAIRLDTEYEPSNGSSAVSKFVIGYALSQGVAEDKVNAWEEDLIRCNEEGRYFYSSNEYLFTGIKN